MRITDVETREQLRDFMTAPSEALTEFMRSRAGDFLVLGAGGKMGPDLVETLVRADGLAGGNRRVIAASRFSNAAVEKRLASLGVDIRKGDLTDRAFLGGLPDAPNVIYMAGFKFGTSHDWRRAFHMNCILPYLVGERFPAADILAFSSGNPYPPVGVGEGGCTENVPLAPQGVYGWCIVARESALATTALTCPEQALCFFRLMYAQHLAYGVLVDLAAMVRQGEPISLAMPAVNLVSQRDAIDVAVRALGQCRNPAFVLNCAGPAVGVRQIVDRMGAVMGREPVLAGEEGDTAMLADDTLCAGTFGPYRDNVDDMVEAAALWVMRSGETWDKPTMFGKVRRDY